MMFVNLRQRSGWSLVEILVVMGVIGVVLGVLMPGVQHVREAAARTECLNNLHQIGLALHNYHDTYRHLPPYRPRREGSREPEILLSWMALILPQMEHDNLWKTSRRACRLDPNPTRNPPHVGYSHVIPNYICPSDGRFSSPLTTPSNDFTAFTSYIGIAGSSHLGRPLPGVLGDAPGISLPQIRDGASNTIMVGERPPPDSLQAGRWYTSRIGIEPFAGPDQYITIPLAHRFGDDLECRQASSDFGPGRTSNPCDRRHMWSLHPHGANFLFADGSVRFLSYGASPWIPSLATRNNGEDVQVEY